MSPRRLIAFLSAATAFLSHGCIDRKTAAGGGAASEVSSIVISIPSAEKIQDLLGGQLCPNFKIDPIKVKELGVSNACDAAAKLLNEFRLTIEINSCDSGIVGTSSSHKGTFSAATINERVIKGCNYNVLMEVGEINSDKIYYSNRHEARGNLVVPRLAASSIPFKVELMVTELGLVLGFPRTERIIADTVDDSLVTKIDHQLAFNVCAECHAKDVGASVAIKNAESLADSVVWTSQTTLAAMLTLSKHTADQKKQIEGFVRVRKKQLLGGFSPRKIQTCEEKVQLNFPKISDDSSLAAAMLSRAVISNAVHFYADQSQPKLWQQATVDNRVATVLTEQRAVNSFMYQQMGYHSDGAREFPWKSPAGTDLSPDIGSVKFMVASRPGSLGVRDRRSSPGYFGTSQNVNGPQLGWTYAEGTIFGEVLTVKDPQDGTKLPFEIRLRMKQDGKWRMDVLRPFENFEELRSGVQQLCVNQATAGCSAAIAQVSQAPVAQQMNRSQFINQARFNTRRNPLVLSKTANEAVAATALTQMIPELDPAIVSKLLKTTQFKSVFGRPWIKSATTGEQGWAPLSNQSFSIVPKDFFGAFVPMTQRGCTSCHSSAGRHVDNFDPDRTLMFAPAPNDAPRPRTWYNFIPGNDGILSFHPFSTQAIANPISIVSMQDRSADLKAINPCVIQDGIFEVAKQPLADSRMEDDR